jgi:hypothetical protein
MCSRYTARFVYFLERNDSELELMMRTADTKEDTTDTTGLALDWTGVFCTQRNPSHDVQMCLQLRLHHQVCWMFGGKGVIMIVRERASCGLLDVECWIGNLDRWFKNLQRNCHHIGPALSQTGDFAAHIRVAPRPSIQFRWVATTPPGLRIFWKESS